LSKEYEGLTFTKAGEKVEGWLCLNEIDYVDKDEIDLGEIFIRLERVMVVDEKVKSGAILDAKSKPVCIGANMEDKSDLDFEKYVIKCQNYNPDHINRILGFFTFY